MINSKKMDSCTELFKTLETLPFYSHYIFSVLLSLVNKKHLFTKNLEVHSNDIRSANIFHLHFTNLARYEKSS